MIKIFILFFLINTFQAQAAELQNKPSQAKLISPFQRVQADSSIDIGIYITLKKGWYTYWQKPRRYWTKSSVEPPSFVLHVLSYLAYPPKDTNSKMDKFYL